MPTSWARRPNRCAVLPAVPAALCVERHVTVSRAAREAGTASKGFLFGYGRERPGRNISNAAGSIHPISIALLLVLYLENNDLEMLELWQERGTRQRHIQ